MTLYNILQIKDRSSFQEIKSAYKRLAMVYHPDRPDANEEKFKEINQAYEFLSNPANKEWYDKTLSEPKKRTRKKKITLEECYFGFSIKQNNKEYKILPGIRSGSKVLLGDTTYTIEVLPHSKFKRANDDLLIEVLVSATEAMLGFDITFKHLNGQTRSVKIKPGIQPDHTVVLKKEGMINSETNTIGDLFIKINITIPNSLTDQEKHAIMLFVNRNIINI